MTSSQPMLYEWNFQAMCNRRLKTTCLFAVKSLFVRMSSVGTETEQPLSRGSVSGQRAGSLRKTWQCKPGVYGQLRIRDGRASKHSKADASWIRRYPYNVPVANVRLTKLHEVRTQSHRYHSLAIQIQSMPCLQALLWLDWYTKNGKDRLCYALAPTQHVRVFMIMTPVQGLSSK
jgi:hypothetical protein